MPAAPRPAPARSRQPLGAGRTSAGRATRRALLAAHLAIIAAAIAAAYARALEVGFLIDDDVSIVGNPGLRGWEPFPLVEPTSRRIAYLSFRLDHALFGLDARAFHATNLVVHALAGFAVYALCRLGLRAAWDRAGRPPPAGTPWIALGAALLFALHPLQTQAVTYAVQRIASLAALFYVAAVALYLVARGAGGAGPRARAAAFAGALVSAVLAMRTKENTVTLPLAILLVEAAIVGATGAAPGGATGATRGGAAPGGRRARFRAALRPVLPFLLLLPLVPLQVAFGSRAQVGPAAADPTRLETTMSRLDYLATQAKVIPTYLRLLAWPAGQHVEWDVPIERSLAAPAVLAGGALVLGLLAAGLALALRARRPGPRLAGVGVVLLFLGLAVESSIFPIADVLFEHRMYLPMAGVALAAAGLVAMALEARPAAAGPLAGAAAAALVALGAASAARNAVWRDPLALYREAALASPGSARAWYSYGNLLLSGGDVAAAEAAFHRALAARPDFALAFDQLGAAAVLRGDYAAAEAWYRKAIAVPAPPIEPFYNLAQLLRHTRRADEAVFYYRVFLDGAPPYAYGPQLEEVRLILGTGAGAAAGAGATPAR